MIHLIIRKLKIQANFLKKREDKKYCIGKKGEKLVKRSWRNFIKSENAAQFKLKICCTGLAKNRHHLC